jgi:hypothetical protein
MMSPSGLRRPPALAIKFAIGIGLCDMEFYLFRPQMRRPFDKLVTVAKCAEKAGFIGMASMDRHSLIMRERSGRPDSCWITP